MAATPPQAPKSARPRARAGSKRAGEADTGTTDTGAATGAADSGDVRATADDPTVASAPTIATTEAARPTPADTHPPEDTIAADPGVTREYGFEQGGEPSAEEIRRRAYELYVERGGQPGLHEDDWYRAEQELRGKRK